MCRVKTAPRHSPVVRPSREMRNSVAARARRGPRTKRDSVKAVLPTAQELLEEFGAVIVINGGTVFELRKAQSVEEIFDI